MNRRVSPAVVLLTTLGLLTGGCRGSTAVQADARPGSDTWEVDLRGAVQKGPFVVGSSVQVSVLNADLTPTGRVFNTQTANDRGEFEISFQSSGPVALEGVGYYYNEVTGQLSSSSLTLRALYSPATSGAQAAYINMVTHLTTGRIKLLVAGGTAFDDAAMQAEDELRRNLAITFPGFAPTVGGVEMNLVGDDNVNNAYLLAVSSVFIQTAANRAGSLEANLQEILNSATLDFADGELGASLKQEITAALLAIDVRRITQQLNQRLAQGGSAATAPNMSSVLDQDRDGITNITDNCDITPNPGQEKLNRGAFGDACSPTWISIPAGTYMMGCVPQDANCSGSEIPRHSVSVPTFEMMETEVTQGQYHNVAGYNPSRDLACGGSCPVSENWTNAKAFCEAVGGRLPSEAEWEYAARAGTTTVYTCGDLEGCLAGIAWFNTDTTGHAVKGKAPNAFGLYDMLGNANEWVADMEHRDYTGAPSDGSAWDDGTNSPLRVLRGGEAHDFDVNRLRASARSGGVNGGGASGGFRCARQN